MDFINTHLLSIIIFLPLLGALIILFFPKENELGVKLTASLSAFISMILSLSVFGIYYSKKLSGFHFSEKINWLSSLGISFNLGVDGINISMLLLTGILAFSAVMVSWNIKYRFKEYFILTLVSLSGIFGVFLSLDLFFFILFYELASIPMFFLIGIWGSDYKSQRGLISKEFAALKLIMYLQLGGGLVLLGILGIYFLAGGNSFDFTLLEKMSIPFFAQVILFPIIFLGFGIEAGFWPFHTWLPNGHSAAPTALSMILAGVLLKMGGYGIIRLGLGLLPYGARVWMPLFIIFAVIGILYGALCALSQKDLKYLIAYSSISHMGIVILGMGIFNEVATSGAIYQMFSHGIITALLFALAGYIYEKTHTRNINEMGGLGIKIPFLAVIFSLGGLASLGLPGMSGFVAEFLVFIGSYKIYPVLAVLAIFGLVITALYILRAVQKIFLGEFNIQYKNIPDAYFVEKIPLVILALTMIIFGFFPNLLIGAIKTDIVKLFMP